MRSLNGFFHSLRADLSKPLKVVDSSRLELPPEGTPVRFWSVTCDCREPGANRKTGAVEISNPSKELLPFGGWQLEKNTDYGHGMIITIGDNEFVFQIGDHRGSKANSYATRLSNGVVLLTDIGAEESMGLLMGIFIGWGAPDEWS